MKFIFIWIFLLCLFVISCTRDKGKPVQTSGCDTFIVKYSTSVKTVLQNNCYSCHSTEITTTGGGLDLENFSSLKNYLNLFYQNDSVYGSKFLHIVNQKGTVLYMPPVGKMTNCELNIIGKWIKLGAPQN